MIILLNRFKSSFKNRILLKLKSDFMMPTIELLNFRNWRQQPQLSTIKQVLNIRHIQKQFDSSHSD